MEARDRDKWLTVDRLHYLLSYDGESGLFTRRITVCNSAKAGSIAGSVSEQDGYVRIAIDGQRYLAHRLAWFYVYGEWPEDQIDHKDRDRTLNAFNNLRPTDNSGNRCNSAVGKNNFLGIKCVRLHESGKYQARIYYDERFHSLGLFETAAEAAIAYTLAAKMAFGEFARAA